MGLDIIAYNKLVIDENGDREEGNYELYCWANPYLNHCKPLEHTQYYKTTGESFGFRAGSYGGYNQWRRQLCELVHKITPNEIWENQEEHKDKAFFNLICFSDCEGTIGSIMANSLAKDFQDHQHIVDELNDEYFKEKYAEWREAFELASDDGAVHFQ